MCGSLSVYVGYEKSYYKIRSLNLIVFNGVCILSMSFGSYSLSVPVLKFPFHLLLTEVSVPYGYSEIDNVFGIWIGVFLQIKRNERCSPGEWRFDSMQQVPLH